ncbi:hypothetical protein B0A53_00683 [Rhodotorula sp. CCFEE 5036]|nr:hypothetical protein B0A53_00683 [Rhodotorula sp. CCFEE 5036]
MYGSSDDEIEILTAPDHRARVSAAPPSSDAFDNSPNWTSLGRTNGDADGHMTASQQLLLLSDDSADEGDDLLPPPFRANLDSQASTSRLQKTPSSLQTTSGPACLPSPTYESPQLQRAHTLALMHELDSLDPSSSSPFGALSSSRQPHQHHPASSSSPALRNMPHLSDDPFADLRTPKAVPPSRPAAKAREPAAAAPPPPAKAVVDKRYDDPWADILDDPAAAAAKKSKSTKASKGKGKEKEKEVDVGGGGEGRKRSLSTAAYEEEDEGLTAKAKRGKVRPMGSTTREGSAGPGGLSKTALKRLETADRVKLREANTLRAGDKKVSTAELTMHISGTAFHPPDQAAEDADVADEAGAGKKRGKRTAATKPSPWLEISREIQTRLKVYDCDVECSPAPSALDCEGAVRWTRVCDRMWSEERKMYIPLVGDERIVVEEDSRLIFLSALDLSQHVADSTLSNYVTTLQSRSLPPHVNLFIMLYGLGTLARDLERARQEAYRNSIRAAGVDDQAATKAVKKLPGIGERQPSKDDLELALIRLQMQTRCMLVSVDKVSEAVDWLEQITFDVGQKPYQRLKHSHIAMLGTSEDKVVSGKDLQDTYIKMLASLPRVTEAIAKGIVAEYPTVRSLYEGYERCRDERERKEMLVGIGKGHNLNGTSTHRAIGKDMSAYIYRVLWSRDPNMYL